MPVFPSYRWITSCPTSAVTVRKACLVEQYELMADIVAKAHHWYANENPQDVPMEKLAKTFQAQYYSSMGDLAHLRDLIHRDPWVVNEP